MKIFGIKALKSKNKRMFFLGGFLLLAIMLGFFLSRSIPKTANTYIGFGFAWLSVIIGVCFAYLIPGKNDRIKRMLIIGMGIYFAASAICNILLIMTVSIYTLIAVDFFLTFGILIYGLFLYYVGNTKES